MTARPVRRDTNPGVTRRKTLAVGLGNFLEFYNFLVFSTFAPMIGHSLLPQGGAASQSVVAWSAFAISFIARPLGAVALGRVAERRGRRLALLASLGLMGLGSAMVAFCPGYGRIGWIATAITIAGRLLQGFSDGGEVGPASVALFDIAPPGRRMGLVLLQFITQNAAATTGVCVGLVLSAWLSEAALYAWGWRVALAAGLAIVPFGLWLRRGLDVGETVGRSAAESETRLGARHALVLCTMLGTTSMAYGRAYGVTYGITVLRMHPRAAMAAMALGLASSVVGMIAGLILTRRLGARTLTIVALLGSMLICEPLYAWAAADRSWGVLAIAQSLIGLVGAMPFAPLLLAMLTAFAPAERATGFGLVYALAVATCGATTPALLSWLNAFDGNPLWPAHVYVVASAIALAGGLALLARSTDPELAPATPLTSASATAAGRQAGG
ncbi:MFS family permease [Endobacter medicaginis]|uniref:MFS family permease n=1 Tax=Endobacter medicaginis TaxID=1181271 RepID=A0A850NP17_9PROT|nr:MFS transporter [Endobacter medicaginis]MBB3172782.1 MFS family permease [Endobacter medicaginis]MCX5474389.1 MFS transporter [Endobacter medicaginis]NVN29790.1 MFS transporter [Endobacter medicaginis]